MGLRRFRTTLRMSASWSCLQRNTTVGQIAPSLLLLRSSRQKFCHFYPPVAFLEKHLDVLEKIIFNSIAQRVTIQKFNRTFKWSQETGHTLGWIILKLATTVYLSRSRFPKENDFAKQTSITKLNLLMKNVIFIRKIISLILYYQEHKSNNSKYLSPNNDQIVIAMIQDPFKQFYHEMKSLRQLILPLGRLKTRIQYLKFFNNGGFHY